MGKRSSSRDVAGFSARFRARDRIANAGMLVGMGVVLALVAAVPLIEMVRTAILHRMEEREWTITGPACPVVAKPSPRATSRRGVMVHTYGDVTYARSFGAVSCAGFNERGWRWERRVYRVCQFNNPGAVTVRTARGRTTFEAMPGQRLTVTVRDGRASCVVGGWFRS